MEASDETDMSKAFDALPWWKRWKTHIRLAMPKRYQNWRGRRAFYRLAHEALQDDGEDAGTCLMRMIATAELNRRNGDDSLNKVLDKYCHGWTASPEVKNRMPWE
jgi:hypothetical protein